MAPDHLRVVHEPAVGDVGVGEKRDDRAADRVGGRGPVQPAALGDLVGVGQLHPLRRPGGARGVDQGQHIGCRDRAPRRLEVEIPGLAAEPLDLGQAQAALGLGIEHDQVLDLRRALDRRLHAVKEGGLDDHHPAARVTEQVGDLLGRRGVVDRERRGPEMHGGGVEQVKLGPVGEHEADRVAPAHAQRVQAAGQLAHTVGVLPKGQADPVVDRAQRHLVGQRGGRELEGLAHRRRPDPGRGLAELERGGFGDAGHDRFTGPSERIRPGPGWRAAGPAMRPTARGC